jgi:hypothetical protein
MIKCNYSIQFNLCVIILASDYSVLFEIFQLSQPASRRSRGLRWPAVASPQLGVGGGAEPTRTRPHLQIVAARRRPAAIRPHAAGRSHELLLA